MPDAGPFFTLFDTPIGACGLVWAGRGLIGVVLPEAGPQATRERVRRRFPGAAEGAPGSTLTYGELAQQLGEPAAARAVGQALGANPFPIIVPCHRVLAAGQRAGGFSAPGGARTKLRLLEIEHAPLGGTPGLFD